MYYHHKNLHQAVKSKKPGDNKKARALWAMKEATDRKEDYYDPNHQTCFQERNHIRLGVWEVHFKSPMAALAKALECWETE